MFSYIPYSDSTINLFPTRAYYPTYSRSPNYCTTDAYARALAQERALERKSRLAAAYYDDGDLYGFRGYPGRRAMLEERTREEAIERAKLAEQRKRQLELEAQAREVLALETRNAAASKIQSTYRTHQSLRAISSLEADFQALKAAFEFPTVLDYVSGTGEIVSVHTTTNTTAATITDGSGELRDVKLAYTQHNAPFHLYTHTLSQLLSNLDGVESRGVKEVRDRRREVVNRVEGEAQWLERWWKGVWARQGQDVIELAPPVGNPLADVTAHTTNSPSPTSAATGTASADSPLATSPSPSEHTTTTMNYDGELETGYESMLLHNDEETEYESATEESDFVIV